MINNRHKKRINDKIVICIQLRFETYYWVWTCWTKLTGCWSAWPFRYTDLMLITILSFILFLCLLLIIYSVLLTKLSIFYWVIRAIQINFYVFLIGLKFRKQRYISNQMPTPFKNKGNVVKKKKDISLNL
jgi:magnesium-transporting ATPase (P-type)